MKPVPAASGGSTGLIFWRGAGHGPGKDGGSSIGLNSWGRETKLRGCERHVDIFEDGLGGDPSYAVRGLDEVVAGPAGLFAAKSVGKDEGFGELTSAHQETGAVDGPFTFKIHSAFFHPSAGQVFVFGFQVSGFDRARSPLGGCLFQVERLYAHKEGWSIHKNCATVKFFSADLRGSNADRARVEEICNWHRGCGV
jgi:hypothetical protein